METFIQKTAAIIQLKRAGNSDLEIVKAMYQAWNIPEHRTREILEQVRDKAADTRGHGLEQYHSVSDWFPELHGERAFNGLFTEEKYLHLLNVLEDAIGGGYNYRLAYWFFKEKNFEDLHRIIVYHQVTLRERGALDHWIDGVGDWYFRNELQNQEFRGGQWHGQNTRFIDGKIVSQGYYLKGRQHGKFVDFFPSGREETIYNDGVIVSSIVFNSDNSVKSKTFYKEGHKLLTQHFKGAMIIKDERFY